MQSLRKCKVTDRTILQVAASNLGVREALIHSCEWAAGLNVVPDELSTFELVLGEVLNNIVEHALPDQPDANFQLEIQAQPDGLHVQTKDNGHPMPDHKIPSSELPATDVPMIDMPEGGFGWPLFLMLAKDVNYARADGTNFLQFNLPILE